jgi:hypothetical protein
MTEPTPAKDELLDHYCIVFTAAGYWQDHCEELVGTVDPHMRMMLQMKTQELDASLNFLAEHHRLKRLRPPADLNERGEDGFHA